MVPLLSGQRMMAELADGRPGEVPELFLGPVLERGSDHLDVGGNGREREMGQTGQQLAPGQVAGRAEQNDDVWRDDLDSPTRRARAGRRIGDGLSESFWHA